MQFVIVGFGVAGFWALKTLLKEHNEIQKIKVTVISEEPTQTYYKCLLSDYISQKQPLYNLSVSEPLINDEHVNFMWGKKVVSLDADSRILHLDSGETVRYDNLLLSSGLRYAGDSVTDKKINGIFKLNNLRDAKDISSYLDADCRKAVVLGENIFGFEMARALLNAKKQVSMICEGEYVAQYLFDKETASLVSSQLPDNLELLTNAKLTRIIDKNGKVAGLELADGRLIETDFVGICDPLIPGTDFIDAGCLDHNGKILVNEQMMTEIPNVFAAGDLTCMCHEPHEFSYGWRRALFQGQVAARSMLGIPSYYSLAPSLRIQIFGYPVILIGMPPVMLTGENTYPIEYSDNLKKIKKRVVVQDGQLIGAVICGNMDKISVIEELIQEGAIYDSQELTSFIEYLQPYTRNNGNPLERCCPVCKSVIDFGASVDCGTLFSCPVCAETLRIENTFRYARDLVVHHAMDNDDKIKI